MQPIRLGPNQPAARPYLGGAGIRAFRGEGSTAPDSPEDFVASTTTVFGDDHVGLSMLPDGRTLREAVASDPEGWLGAAHVSRFGAETGLLVKLLHTGQRLFNHVHPDDAFAQTRLGAPRGKTEAWFIVDTGEAPTATVWLGFAHEVAAAQLRDWFERQDAAAMLAAMTELTVRAGDWVYVPAGTPHAIGPGITLVELQQPTDLSLILEYAGFPALDRAGALLGLSPEVALAAVDTAPLGPENAAQLHGRVADAGRSTLFPPAAQRFFRAEHLVVEGAAEIPAGFGVVVVLEGAGRLRWGGGGGAGGGGSAGGGGADGADLAISRGETFVVPHGAGALEIAGQLRLIHAAPPAA
ncbi:class I mannose-6-phosphate isomerase [Gryllotalpicola daejeonensis]|uniref:Class I mannose-6-phosphate isomerase n=1 Tax=Gryllotalpicola daejeonensis TaxID=993087 RepID=A0ABP7ZJU7_9MICO